MTRKCIRQILWVLIVVQLVALASCKDSITRRDQYRHFEQISNGGWSMDDEFFFSTSSLDSTTLYQVDLVLRLEHGFPYQSLPIGVTFETPSRQLSTEVIHIKIDNSMWNKGGYNFFEQQVTLSDRTQFPEKGVYTYSFRHLLADSLVYGVVELGLIIKPKV